MTTEGFIPAFQQCKHWDRCTHSTYVLETSMSCHCTGSDHTYTFVCGWARAYELMDNVPKNTEN